MLFSASYHNIPEYLFIWVLLSNYWSQAGNNLVQGCQNAYLSATQKPFLLQAKL